MVRAKKTKMHCLPPAPSGRPPMPPEFPIPFLEDLIIEAADRNVKDLIREVLGPLEAQREFCDLEDEVEERRSEARRRKQLYHDQLDGLKRLATQLNARSDVSSVGEIARRFLSGLGEAVEPLLTEMSDMMLDVSSIMLSGLQRRIECFCKLFRATADEVLDRNDTAQTELKAMETAILELQLKVRNLEEAAPLLMDRTLAAESALKDARSELQEVRRPRPCSSRGRSPALHPSAVLHGPGSRASSRAQSEERLRQATARGDVSEAVRQAQKLAVLQVIDDVSHPVGASAAEMWEEEHGQPF